MTPAEAWLMEFMWRYGEPPDMGPSSNYDYGKALSAGVQPRRAEDGMYHWPSRLPDGGWLKKPDHPTKWMEDYAGLLGSPPVGLDAERAIYRALTGGLLD